MDISAKKAFLREALILLGVLSVLIISQRMGQVSFKLPFHPSVRAATEIPKYHSAEKDPSMILFENGEVFLFSKPPADKEVAGAYSGQDILHTNAAYRILYPTNTYINLWVFHINPTFGFCDVEFDQFGLLSVLIAYPIYLIVRGILWFHKEVTRGLNRL